MRMRASSSAIPTRRPVSVMSPPYGGASIHFLGSGRGGGMADAGGSNPPDSQGHAGSNPAPGTGSRFDRDGAVKTRRPPSGDTPSVIRDVRRGVRDADSGSVARPRS